MITNISVKQAPPTENGMIKFIISASMIGTSGKETTVSRSLECPNEFGIVKTMLVDEIADTLWWVEDEAVK